MRELVYPKVVKCFYSNMKFKEKGLITTIVNGKEIKFDVEELCGILEILKDELCLYESKKWPKVDGFKPVGVVQRLCEY